MTTSGITEGAPEPHWTNDLDPWGLVCSASPGPTVVGEPDTYLSHTPTLPLPLLILEPEDPAGGMN
jgi:hypothetical protein